MAEASGRRSSFSINGPATILGDAIAGDKYVSADAKTRVFFPLDEIIDRQNEEVREAARHTKRALEKEVSKGRQADDPYMAKLIEGMIALIPASVSAIVGAFASPLLSGVAGPVTKAILERF